MSAKATDAERAWWREECLKEMRGEDSWMSHLGLLRGTYFRIGWAPGERESFEAWRGVALGLNNPLTGDTV